MFRKDLVTANIIEEHEMRQVNSKESMVQYLDKYLNEIFEIPDEIKIIKRDEKQLSLEIFGKYICFDYSNKEIEVRYTAVENEEIYIGSIIFDKNYSRPLWKNANGVVTKFNIREIENFFENAFLSFEPINS